VSPTEMEVLATLLGTNLLVFFGHDFWDDPSCMWAAHSDSVLHPVVSKFIVGPHYASLVFCEEISHSTSTFPLPIKCQVMSFKVSLMADSTIR